VSAISNIPTRTISNSGILAYQYPVQPTPQTGKVVRQLTSSNGVGDDRRVTYQYRDAATHVAGRGSLGFASVISTDLQTGFVTTTRYSQEWPRVGMVLNTSTVAGSCTISKTDNAPEVAAISQANGIVTRYPYVKSTTTTRRDIDPNCSDLGTVSTNVLSLDAWANVKVQEVTTRDSLETFVTKTETDYRNDPDLWLLGLPTHTVLTKTTSAPQASRQRTMDFDYDAATGLLKQEIVEKNNVQLQVITDYERDNPFGLVSKKTQRWFDPVDRRDDARSVGTTYDPKGRYPATVTNAENHVETHAYYPETGARKSVKDANQVETSWVVDGFGRPVKEVHADGNEVRIYVKACQGDCPAGAVVAQITDTFHGGDRITVPQVLYSDNAGHVLRALTWGFDGRAVITDQRYDRRGRLFEKDQPRFDNQQAYLESRMAYDDFDRVIETARYDDAGSLKSSVSIYKGLKTELTNARGYRRIEERNVIGQVKAVTDPNNKVTSFEYEPFGGLAKTVDPNGNVIRVEYDNLGRKTALRDPNLGHIEYVVDPLGRTISQMSPKQRAKFNANNLESEKTRTRYDKLDRMVARYEPDLESHWIFDTAANGIGKLAEAYTQTGSARDYQRVHTYDAVGRPGRTTQALTDGTYAATPGYDAWGRLISQAYQRNNDPAKVFDTRYSNTGYLARIERGSLVLWQVNEQDASLRSTSIALGNGLNQTRGFYPHSGRMRNSLLATAGGEPRLPEGYEYDALGNVVVRTQHWDLGFREVFSYDALNRIETSTVDGQPTQAFRYDASGNMLSKTGVGTGDYVYPAQGVGSVRPHAVQSIPGVGSFAYDDNGNLVSGGNRSVSWTSFDMPDKINGAGASAQFVYGPEHQRTRQTRGDSTTVIYAGAQEIETNAGGTTVKTYWPNGIGVEIDRPNAAVSELYWHHLDRLGSVVGLTDQQGVLKEKLAYDAWGKRRTTDGKPMEGTPTPNSLDGNVDNRGFTGHEMLDQLDLVHMNGRVYDPFTARFMSGDPLIQDPIDGQNYNRYSYVLNNPTNNTDPTGFECETMTGSRICGADTGAGCSGNCNSGMFHVDKSRPHDNDLKKKGDGKVDPKSGGNLNNMIKNNSINSEPHTNGETGQDGDDTDSGAFSGATGERQKNDSALAKTDRIFTIEEVPFRIKGGTIDQQLLGEMNFKTIFATQPGYEMLTVLESRTDFMGNIKEFTLDYRYPNRSDAKYFGNTLKIDPNYVQMMDTTAGRIRATLIRLMAHELGHAVYGYRDDGPGRMRNVLKSENPIMRALKMPERLNYED